MPVLSKYVTEFSSASNLIFIKRAVLFLYKCQKTGEGQNQLEEACFPFY